MEAGPNQQIVQTPSVTVTPRGILFLLVARGHVATDNDWAWGEGDFAADLLHLIPARCLDRRGDKQIADVDFAEVLFFFSIHLGCDM